MAGDARRYLALSFEALQHQLNVRLGTARGEASKWRKAEKVIICMAANDEHVYALSRVVMVKKMCILCTIKTFCELAEESGSTRSFYFVRLGEHVYECRRYLCERHRVLA